VCAHAGARRVKGVIISILVEIIVDDERVLFDNILIFIGVFI
jgi:hypothetical protein